VSFRDGYYSNSEGASRAAIPSSHQVETAVAEQAWEVAGNFDDHGAHVENIREAGTKKKRRVRGMATIARKKQNKQASKSSQEFLEELTDGSGGM